MKDFEFRIVTPTLRRLVFNKKSTEQVLIDKIPKQHISIDNLDTLNNHYFTNLKKINKIMYRGLPINSKLDFIKSELELESCFLSLKNKVKKNFNKVLYGERIIQIPNPKKFLIGDYKKFIRKNFPNSSYSGFELIPNWHQSVNQNISIRDYDKFFEFVEYEKKFLCYETDFPFKKYHSAYNFFYIINKFPNIKILLPHLGCGIFLYDSYFKEKKIKKKFDVYTSAPKSLEWLTNIKKKYLLKNINIYFGSDHPFNGDTSFKIYKAYNKWKNSK